MSTKIANFCLRFPPNRIFVIYVKLDSRPREFLSLLRYIIFLCFSFPSTMNTSIAATARSCSSRTFISKSPDSVLMVFIVLFSIFGLVGSVLNATAIYLYLRWGPLRRSINKLYFSLAISDLFMTTLFTAMKLLQIFFTEHCGVNTFGRYVAGFIPVTATTVAAISYAQYKHLKFAHTFNAAAQKPDTLWLILISWCSPIVLILSLAISMLAITIVGFFFFIGYYVVFALCYRLVIYQLLHQYKQGRDLNLSREERVNVCTLHKESTQLVGLIMLNSVLCSLPMLVFNASVCALKVSDEPLIQPHTAVLSGTAQLFYVVNSCMNPTLCFYKHRDLRKAAMKTLRLSNKVQPVT